MKFRGDSERAEVGSPLVLGLQTDGMGYRPGMSHIGESTFHIAESIGPPQGQEIDT